MEGNEQIIPIDEIIVHPDYDPKTIPRFDYDVALIKLREPIKFNNDVRPVCLPTMEFPNDTDCYVTGWGYTAEKGNIAQVFIQMIFIFCGQCFIIITIIISFI